MSEAYPIDDYTLIEVRTGLQSIRKTWLSLTGWFADDPAVIRKLKADLETNGIGVVEQQFTFIHPSWKPRP